MATQDVVYQWLNSGMYSVFDVNLIFRSEVIALMKEVSGYSLPLFKFIEMFEKRSVVDVAFNVGFFCVFNFYRPPTKVWEDSVFRSVCLSVHTGVFQCDHCRPLQTYLLAPPPPRAFSYSFTWDPQPPLALALPPSYPLSLPQTYSKLLDWESGRLAFDQRPCGCCPRISWFVLT